MQITDWRKEFILTCQRKGINYIKYANEHGIDKQTTQEEYREIVSALEDYVELQGEPDNAISMNEI